MENYYILIVALLFILAISDLIVGVSNDAVNFLNSAIGAKAAPIKVIMIIATLGIIVGATFSNGMMEVARKGIFNPQHFFFAEIMIIFLAVMMTDIILLDTFNTLGLPTSTTVSIVFELLGAAVAVSTIKLMAGDQIIALEGGGEKIAELVDYINTGKAMLIIFGILLSVVVAFSVGAIVQYISRLMFSFRYKKRMKYFGAIWGGLAISAITFFILIKGSKGASFMSGDTKDWIKDNTMIILAASFIAWTVLLYLLNLLIKVNILKIIIFVGTFALAMAFAGNDLVNFIGVPLAGYESFKTWVASGASPDGLSMGSLAGKVQTETYMLLLAGLIMTLTLWFSKKAKKVIKTSLDLSRQDQGEERFGSSAIARGIVRSNSKAFKKIEKFTPAGVNKFVQKQFEIPKKPVNIPENELPAFDMIRASVNLVVASILISIGTSFKLPLSTTYVTFMVAMGTSLADRAWGRDSAVYRITGVISVIGGWFLTALSAFTVAFFVAIALYFGGPYAIGVLLIIALLLIYTSHKTSKKKDKDKEIVANEEEVLDSNIIDKCTYNVTDSLTSIKSLYAKYIVDLTNEDRKQLKEVIKSVNVLNERTKHLKDNVYKTINKLQNDPVDTSHYYVQVLDFLRETAHCLYYISKPGYEYVSNNHPELIEVQVTELEHVKVEFIKFFNEMINVIENHRYDDVPKLIDMQQILIAKTKSYRKNQIRRVKNETLGTRNSMLYLSFLHETKNLLLHSVNLIKAQRDFVEFRRGN